MTSRLVVATAALVGMLLGASPSRADPYVIRLGCPGIGVDNPP